MAELTPQQFTGMMGKARERRMAKVAEQERLAAEYSEDLSGQAMGHATPHMPQYVKDIVAKTNTSTFGFAPKNPQFIPSDDIAEVLGAAGFTPQDRSQKGVPYIMSGPDRLPMIASTMAHEGYHQGTTNNTPYPKYYPRAQDPRAPYEDTPGSKEILDSLGWRMRGLQPSAKDQPYWGANATEKTANELLANLKGFEGGLPKGTSLEDTVEGRMLFGPSEFPRNDPSPQARKDYYYNNISYPGVGLWEGQEERGDGMLQRAKVNTLQWLNSQHPGWADTLPRWVDTLVDRAGFTP